MARRRKIRLVPRGDDPRIYTPRGQLHRFFRTRSILPLLPAHVAPHAHRANAPFIGRSGSGLYGDFVCEVDWVVGQIMAALERRGIADDTLLIFTSDNGPECAPAADGGSYEHARLHGHYSMGNLRGVKRDVWEGGHRVPFLARWPGVVPAGSVCDQLTTLGDFMATCAELTDVDLREDEGEDSVSMLPLLEGDTDAPVRDFAVHHSCHGTFAIRRGDWVYIDAPDGDDNREPDWFKVERGYTAHDFPGELFNLDVDISERVNRYGDHPDLVGRCRRCWNE